MRGKKAKLLRKFAVTAAPKAPMKTRYEALKPVRMFSRPPVPGDVLPNPSVIFPGHVKMAGCHRLVYQDMKRQYRLQNQFGRRI